MNVLLFSSINADWVYCVYPTHHAVTSSFIGMIIALATSMNYLTWCCVFLLAQSKHDYCLNKAYFD